MLPALPCSGRKDLAGLPELPAQLLCNPGEVHGDIEYFYEVTTDEQGTTITAYKVEHKHWDQPITRADLRRIGRGMSA